MLVKYMAVQPCKIWAKASIDCIDFILYTCEESQRPSAAACGIETQSENRMRHVYEKERAADSGRSLAVREWRKHRTIRVNGALSRRGSGKKPRQARVEKHLLLVNAAQTNIQQSTSEPVSPVTSQQRCCRKEKFDNPAPGLAGPFCLFHANQSSNF